MHVGERAQCNLEASDFSFESTEFKTCVAKAGLKPSAGLWLYSDVLGRIPHPCTESWMRSRSALDGRREGCRRLAAQAKFGMYVKQQQGSSFLRIRGSTSGYSWLVDAGRGRRMPVSGRIFEKRGPTWGSRAGIMRAGSKSDLVSGRLKSRHVLSPRLEL